MAETLIIKLDNVLVDPTLFSPRRTAPVDEEYLARLVESLEAGEALPPVRLAPLADPLRDEVSCGDLHTQQALAGWQSRQRRIPWANRPLRPDLVLVDGLTRYHALRLAGETQVEAIVDAEPAGTRAEVLTRALSANLRNARALGDTDLRQAFCLLWLGREVRERYERFVPEKGALSCDEIARRLGKAETWVSEMKRFVQVTHAAALDLKKKTALLIARLEADEWRSFCWEANHLRLHDRLDDRGVASGSQGTVLELTVAEIQRLIERRLAQFEPTTTAAAPTPAPTTAADEPRVEPSGQYILDFEVDTVTPVENLRQIKAVSEQLPIDQVATYYAYANLVLAEAEDTIDRLKPILKRNGWEI